MDYSSEESQQQSAYRVLSNVYNTQERNNRSPPQQRFSTSQQLPIGRASPYLVQGQPSPINRQSQIPSKAQFQTPVQRKGNEDQGSQKSSIIRQSNQSDDAAMEVEVKDEVEDYNYRLGFIYKQLYNSPVGAIDVIEQLILDYDQEKLRMVNNSENLDRELIIMIYQSIQRLDDSLTSNIIRILSQQARREWEIQNGEEIKRKGLQDLAIEQSNCGLFLLTIFYEPTEQWKKALQNQQFVSLPESLLKALIEDSQFDYLVECILFHQSATYSQFVTDKIWSNLVQDDNQYADNAQMMQNIELILELCGKSLDYLRDFLKKGFFRLVLFIFIKYMSDSYEFVEQITKFINQILELEIPSLIGEIQRSGLMIVLTQTIKEVQLTDAGYHSLENLQQTISILYKGYFGEIFTSQEWYQQILFKLFSQRVNEKISLNAEKELSIMRQNYKQIFDQFLMERQDYLDTELQLRLQLLMK
ncbi:hypothetical protein pb186bvf_003803 [Paramecium bursaria]